MTLEFTRNELVGEPEERSLATGKPIVSFNMKITEKIINLNTGDRFDYQNKSYEIMNKESINSPVSYLKFNCFLKV